MSIQLFLKLLLCCRALVELIATMIRQIDLQVLLSAHQTISQSHLLHHQLQKNFQAFLVCV
jgi:hypothetical protein